MLCKKDKVDLTPFHLSYIIELMLCVISFCSVLNPPVQSSGKHVIMFTAHEYNYCTTVCFTDNYFNPIKYSNSVMTMLRTACLIYMQFCVQYHQTAWERLWRLRLWLGDAVRLKTLLSAPF